MTRTRRILAASSLLLALSLAGCARIPRIRLESVGRADPARAVPYVELGPDEAPRALRVVRGGRVLPLQGLRALEKGDVLETTEAGVAVIAFEDSGKVVLAPGTRVRIGSLEVLLGKIFASVRGLFTAETDAVVAGVEGTQFKVEVTQEGAMRVVVGEGVVTCRSKTASWPATPVQAEHAFSLSPYGGPEVVQASDDELRDLARWVSSLAGAADTRGY